MTGLKQIKQLHVEYCARTGFDILLNMSRENTWKDWLFYNRDQPFTVEDLKLVIAYLRAKIRAGERNDGALRFRNLIGNPDYFEEDLEQAKAWRKSNRSPFGGVAKAKPKLQPEVVETVSLEELAAMRKEAGL